MDISLICLFSILHPSPLPTLRCHFTVSTVHVIARNQFCPSNLILTFLFLKVKQFFSFFRVTKFSIKGARYSIPFCIPKSTMYHKPGNAYGNDSQPADGM